MSENYWHNNNKVDLMLKKILNYNNYVEMLESCLFICNILKLDCICNLYMR